MLELNRESFEQAAEMAGVSVYEDYSGRGMYGEKCVGITCDALGDLIMFVTEWLAYDGGPLDWLVRVQEDSMGLGTIYYWPGTTLATS